MAEKQLWKAFTSLPWAHPEDLLLACTKLSQRLHHVQSLMSIHSDLYAGRLCENNHPDLIALWLYVFPLNICSCRIFQCVCPSLSCPSKVDLVSGFLKCNSWSRGWLAVRYHYSSGWPGWFCSISLSPIYCCCMLFCSILLWHSQLPHSGPGWNFPGWNFQVGELAPTLWFSPS